LSAQVKKNEVEGRDVYMVQRGSLREREYVKDLGGNGRIILKWIFKS